MEIEKIQNLIGAITKEQLRYIDCYVDDYFIILIPKVGPCTHSSARMHTHPSYSCALSFDNFTSIQFDDRLVKTSPGKLYLMSPGVSHKEVFSQNFSRYIAMFIETAFFRGELAKYEIKENMIFKADDADPSKDLIFYIKEFMTEYENKLPGHTDLLEAMRLKIVHTIIRAAYKVQSPEDMIRYRLDIDKAIAYMHSNYEKKITVEDIAESISVSPSHFTRIFKQETGASPIEYLIKLRLDMACRLLRLGEKSVTDIALDCGFNSSSHFSSCFLKKFPHLSIRV